MTDPIDIEGQRLFKRFLAGGFTPLVYDESLKLSEYLTHRAVSSGSAALTILADAIRSVYFFLLEHGEAGGIRIGFVEKLDRLAIDNLGSFQRLEPPEAARVAQDFRVEIKRRLDLYNPKNTY